MELLLRILNWIKKIMNPQSTDKLTQSTSNRQLKIILYSPNNLPNDNSSENFQNLHQTSYLNIYGNKCEAASYIRNAYFNEPVLYDSYLKRNITGKQIIDKTVQKNIYNWLPTGATENTIYTYMGYFPDVADGTSAYEYFYILFSEEIVV